MYRFLIPVVALLISAGSAATAEPVPYHLEKSESHVGFEVDFGLKSISGTIPIKSADVMLDFRQTNNSVVSVVLDGAGAVANFPFASRMLRGPQVLATDQFESLKFRSTDLRADGQRARISGKITIRGETRPITFDAQLFRQPGSAADDFSKLFVRLSGSVQRSDFGADGWSDMVGDTVKLDILVHIVRME